METNKKLTIEVESNLDDVIKSIDDLKSSFDNVQKGIDDTNTTLEGVKKKTDDNSKATKSLADGFKGVGLAVKAIGIGLVIDGFNMLKDIFMKNEKVAKLVGTAMETISIVLSDVVNIVVDVVDKVSKSTNGFEHLGKVVMGLITIALTPLKIVFFEIKLAVQAFMLAWEQSPFGDGDPTRIKELTKGIDETKNSLIQTGKEALKAGKDVVTNFSGAVKEIGSVVEGAVDGISKISIAGSIAQAQANVDAKNAAIIAAAEQARLVEQYDRLAEKQRQIRDDDSKTIAERQAANNKLGEILKQQEAAMLRQADLQIQAARNEAAKNKTAENTAAVIDAIANKEGVLAQIEGLRSEQLANVNTLKKEEITLTQTAIDGDTKRAIENKKFTNSMIKDTTDRLDAERAAILEERKLEDERLTNKRDSYKKGTQAWEDANQELLDSQAKTSQAIITNNKSTNDALAAENKLRIDRIKGDNSIDFSDRFTALQEELDIINSTEYTSQEAKNAALIANSKAKADLEQEFEVKKNEAIAMSKENLSNIISGIEETGLAKTKAGQAVSKALALVQIGIDSAVALGNATKLANAEGVAAQLAFPTVPGAGTIARITSYVSTAAQVATNIVRAKQLLSSKGAAAGSAPAATGAGAAQGGAPAAAPQFNVVGTSGTNQLASTIAGQQNQPIQAFVVGSEVTTQQALDRNRVNNATFL